MLAVHHEVDLCCLCALPQGVAEVPGDGKAMVDLDGYCVAVWFLMALAIELDAEVRVSDPAGTQPRVPGSSAPARRMPSQREVLHDEVTTAYPHFALESSVGQLLGGVDGELPQGFGAYPGGRRVHTREGLSVTVRAVLYPEEPEADVTSYDAVFEAALYLQRGRLALVDTRCREVATASVPSGLCQVRVLGAGVGIGAARPGEGHESWLVELWPGVWRAPKVVRAPET